MYSSDSFVSGSLNNVQCADNMIFNGDNNIIDSEQSVIFGSNIITSYDHLFLVNVSETDVIIPKNYQTIFYAD